MPLRNAALHLTPSGLGSMVEIDGHRLAGVRGVTIKASATERPQLAIDLIMHNVSVIGEMDVTVPDKTRDTLIALGWTPPAEQDPTKD